MEQNHNEKDSYEEKLNTLQHEISSELETVTRRNKKIRKQRAFAKATIQICFWAFVLFILMRFVFGIASVQGSSMEDTLHDGDIVIYNRLANNYSRGDIVVARARREGLDIVKRIAALPDETVNISAGGDLLINGTALDEPYLKSKGTFSENAAMPVTLGSNEYFLLGDNRPVSKDSRSSDIGNIDAGDIKGKVILLIRAY